MMHGIGNMGGFMGFGWLIWIVVIGLVIWAVIRITNGNANSFQESNSKRAEDILKQRYARGDIDREEYLNIKQDL
jgi:putative membrane protein